MLNGWATLAGAIAIVYAAKVGANTFNSWRRQKQEERRMDAAERILTLAYRLRHNLEAIRSPFISGGELAGAEERLKNDDNRLWVELEDSRKRRFTSAQVVKLRLAHFSDETNEVWALRPVARAYFGPQIEERLQDLWQCHVEVSAAADSYADTDGGDRDFEIQLRRELYSGGTPNPMNETIATTIAGLERELLPVIRSNPDVD
jgi:hypothetical protein